MFDSAQPSRTNDASLCYNHSIERDPWPWIAHKKEQWSFCPFTGGFDFRVYFPGRKKVTVLYKLYSEIPRT